MCKYVMETECPWEGNVTQALMHPLSSTQSSESETHQEAKSCMKGHGRNYCFLLCPSTPSLSLELLWSWRGTGNYNCEVCFHDFSFKLISTLLLQEWRVPSSSFVFLVVFWKTKSGTFKGMTDLITVYYFAHFSFQFALFSLHCFPTSDSNLVCV